MLNNYSFKVQMPGFEKTMNPFKPLSKMIDFFNAGRKSSRMNDITFMQQNHKSLKEKLCTRFTKFRIGCSSRIVTQVQGFQYWDSFKIYNLNNLFTGTEIESIQPSQTFYSRNNFIQNKASSSEDFPHWNEEFQTLSYSVTAVNKSTKFKKMGLRSLESKEFDFKFGLFTPNGWSKGFKMARFVLNPE